MRNNIFVLFIVEILDLSITKILAKEVVIKKIFKLLLVLVLTELLLIQCQPDTVYVYLIGDSTMSDKAAEKEPETGWGQMLPTFFVKNVKILNHAVNGRSSKSFINEGHWQAVLDSLKPGNWVLIQFGHNDEKEYDSTRYTMPRGAYKHNLQLFVNDTKSKGAYPILLTSIVRRRFDEDGKFFDTHGDYPSVVREVADDMKVPLIDLHKSTQKLVEQYGEEKSKDLFLWVKPGEYDGYPDGKQDNTHFNKNGAKIIACIVSKELKSLDSELSRHLKKDIMECY